MLAPLPGAGAVLLIEDHGRGMPAGAGLLRRGTSGTGSTGLGLDIARSTAEASGGRLRIDNRLYGGASVRLELGAPAENAKPPT